MAADARTPLELSGLLERLGGLRGVADGAAPSLVLVLVNAAAAPQLGPQAALGWALGAAVSTAAGVVVLRAIRGRPLRSALTGLVGLAIATTVAARTGEARDFFLPGIYVDAAYAVGLATSVLLGRPLIATLHRLLTAGGDDSGLHRAFAVATLGWAGVYGLRAAVQAALYAAEQPTGLAAAKLLLGWPLTAAAVALTLAYLKRVAVSAPSATAAGSVTP